MTPSAVPLCHYTLDANPDPEGDARERLTLAFSTADVVVTGARLALLLEPLHQHRLASLAAMDARMATLKSLGVEPGQVQFAAHFGRNMEYYTGLVFELWARDKEGPVQIAGGGRYDTLLETLGAKQPVSAIGCAIRTERVLAVKGAA